MKRQTQLSDNNMIEMKIIIHPQVNCSPVITQVYVLLKYNGWIDIGRHSHSKREESERRKE